MEDVEKNDKTFIVIGIVCDPMFYKVVALRLCFGGLCQNE